MASKPQQSGPPPPKHWGYSCVHTSGRSHSCWGFELMFSCLYSKGYYNPPDTLTRACTHTHMHPHLHTHACAHTHTCTPSLQPRFGLFIFFTIDSFSIGLFFIVFLSLCFPNFLSLRLTPPWGRGGSSCVMSSECTPLHSTPLLYF